MRSGLFSGKSMASQWKRINPIGVWTLPYGLILFVCSCFFVPLKSGYFQRKEMLINGLMQTEWNKDMRGNGSLLQRIEMFLDRKAAVLYF